MLTTPNWQIYHQYLPVIPSSTPPLCTKNNDNSISSISPNVEHKHISSKNISPILYLISVIRLWRGYSRNVHSSPIVSIANYMGKVEARRRLMIQSTVWVLPIDFHKLSIPSMREVYKVQIICINLIWCLGCEN